MEYGEIREIDEREIPNNWLEETLSSFNSCSPYYSTIIANAEPWNEKVNNTIEDLVAYKILEKDLHRILEQGTGDGTRLLRIQDLIEAKYNDYGLSLLGTELADRMLEKARENGINAVKHDMSKPLPSRDQFSDLDAIIWFNGDFGYIMDSDSGVEKRVNSLTDAYSKLNTGGFIALDILSQDTEDQHNNGEAMRYSRIPVFNGERQAPLPFWIKQFRFMEIKRLLEDANIPLEQAKATYVITYEVANSSIDLSNSGSIAFSDLSFKDPTIDDTLNVINANREYTEEKPNYTEYRMFVTIDKSV